MHRIALVPMVLTGFVASLALAQAPTNAGERSNPRRLVIKVIAAPSFDGATVSTSVDAPLVQAGDYRLTAKIDADSFELCLPGTTLPAELTVAWSPRVRQTFSLASPELAAAVKPNADGSLRVDLRLGHAGVSVPSGPIPPNELGFAGRFGGRAGARAIDGELPALVSAADRGLAWLVAEQRVDGAWNGVTSNPPRATEGDCLATAAACLALLANGSTFKSGPHRTSLQRGLCWLVEHTDAKTGRVSPPSPFAPLEEQAFTALTLSEAFGLASFRPLRDPARDATLALGAMLGDEHVSDRRDAGALGFTAMALVSARQFLRVSGDALTRAVIELEGGSLEVAPLRDAAAMLVGFFVDDPGLTAIERRTPNLLANLPERGANLDATYVYFATYALYQAGQPVWTEWTDSLKKNLPGAQVQGGDLDGSWAPGDPRAQMRGRAWTTAMRLLTVQCFLRFAR